MKLSVVIKVSLGFVTDYSFVLCELVFLLLEDSNLFVMLLWCVVYSPGKLAYLFK